MNSVDKRILKIKPGDFVILAFFIIIPILFLIMFFSNSGGTSIVELSCNGKIIMEVSLDKPGVYLFEKDNVKIKFLVTPDKRVTVTEANCPLNVCVRSKPISRNGESIICIPNKVIISIKNKKDSGIDSTTY